MMVSGIVLTTIGVHAAVIGPSLSVYGKGTPGLFGGLVAGGLSLVAIGVALIVVGGSRVPQRSLVRQAAPAGSGASEGAAEVLTPPD